LAGPLYDYNLHPTDITLADQPAIQVIFKKLLYPERACQLTGPFFILRHTNSPIYKFFMAKNRHIHMAEIRHTSCCFAAKTG